MCFLLLLIISPAIAAAEQAAAETRERLAAVTKAALAADYSALLQAFVAAERAGSGKDLILFYEGALIALENVGGDSGQALAAPAPVRSAFLAGKHAGLSQRHLLLVESAPLPEAGWGARLAAESVAAHYYLGRLIEALPLPDEARSLYIVFFAAAFRHWLCLDARQTAECAVVVRDWLHALAAARLAFGFDYLADLSTSAGLADGRLPADAPAFYKVSEPVDGRLLEIFRRRPASVAVLAAAEPYAYPYRYRWLEPAGLSVEHLEEAGGLQTLDGVREQLDALYALSRSTALPPTPNQ